MRKKKEREKERRIYHQRRKVEKKRHKHTPSVQPTHTIPSTTFMSRRSYHEAYANFFFFLFLVFHLAFPDFLRGPRHDNDKNHHTIYAEKSFYKTRRKKIPLQEKKEREKVI